MSSAHSNGIVWFGALPYFTRRFGAVSGAVVSSIGCQPFRRGSDPRRLCYFPFFLLFGLSLLSRPYLRSFAASFSIFLTSAGFGLPAIGSSYSVVSVSLQPPPGFPSVHCSRPLRASRRPMNGATAAPRRPHPNRNRATQKTFHQGITAPKPF